MKFYPHRVVPLSLLRHFAFNFTFTNPPKVYPASASPSLSLPSITCTHSPTMPPNNRRNQRGCRKGHQPYPHQHSAGSRSLPSQQPRRPAPDTADIQDLRSDMAEQSRAIDTTPVFSGDSRPYEVLTGTLHPALLEGLQKMGFQ